MKTITVTRKTNVQDVTDSGDILLVDEAQIGYLGKTHASVVTIADEEGNPQLGFLAKVEVFWEDKRNPAPALEDPSELVWLDINASDDTDYDEEEDEVEESDEYSDSQEILV